MSDKIDTQCVRSGYTSETDTLSFAVPLYQTSAYQFTSSEHATRLFALEEAGNIYTRLGNPTVAVLEKRVAEMEGGIGALATASGHSAIFLSIFNIVGQGDEIVASSWLYGGTLNMFTHSFKRLGITTRFVDPSNPENFRKAITPKTKLVFAELLSNPSAALVDIEAVGRIAHENGLPFFVDATFNTPCLCKPMIYGADIVIHSMTKYMEGHGTSLGGIVVDGGTFDWGSGKFPTLSEPDPSYHGVNYVKDIGKAAFITRLRVQGLRDFGPCLSPFNAFMILNGLSTLSVRMERLSANALAVAKHLEKSPHVSWVKYPGLPSSPDYRLAQKYLPKGCGAIFTFGVKGGMKAARQFINSLKIFSNVANVGDVRSMVIHPASTTHSQLSGQALLQAGVTEDTLRLSVGLEDVGDLVADLDQAILKSQE